jgi:hypothetical protein
VRVAVVVSYSLLLCKAVFPITTGTSSKVALVYLEQCEVLGSDYWVLFDGYCDSPSLGLTAIGSLGFTADWFIRPRKGKKLLRLVRDKCLSKSRRHSSLKKLFYFERREADRDTRAAAITSLSAGVYSYQTISLRKELREG